MGRRATGMMPVSDQCWALFLMGLAAERKTEERREVRRRNCARRYRAEKIDDAHLVLQRIFQLFSRRGQNSYECLAYIRLRKAIAHRCEFEGARCEYRFYIKEYAVLKIRESFYVVAVGETMGFRRPGRYWNALYMFRVKGEFEPSLFDVKKRLAAIRDTDMVMLSTFREVLSFEDSKLGLHNEMVLAIEGLDKPRSMYTERDAYQLFWTMIVCLRRSKVKK